MAEARLDLCSKERRDSCSCTVLDVEPSDRLCAHKGGHHSRYCLPWNPQLGQNRSAALTVVPHLGQAINSEPTAREIACGTDAYPGNGGGGAPRCLRSTPWTMSPIPHKMKKTVSPITGKSTAPMR